jgi:hypothetical protein
MLEVKAKTAEGELLHFTVSYNDSKDSADIFIVHEIKQGKPSLVREFVEAMIAARGTPAAAVRVNLSSSGDRVVASTAYAAAFILHCQECEALYNGEFVHIQGVGDVIPPE